MNSKNAVLAAALAVLGLGVAPWSASAAPLSPRDDVVVIRNVNVIGTQPGQKKLRRKQTVIVENGTITVVDKAKRVEIPEGAVVIEGRRKYLLPGLADMHVHFDFLNRLPEPMTEEDAYTLLLANGITTVLDMAGFDKQFGWRRDLNQGRTLGPRLFFTSPQVRDNSVAGAAGAESRVREWVAKGYELIKVHTPLAEPTFRRVAEVARELGVPVVGHAARPDVDFSVSLEEGMRTLAHAEELLWVQSPETLDELEDAFDGVPDNVAALAATDTWLTGSLVVEDVFTKTAGDDTFAEQLASPFLNYFPPSLRDDWANNNPNRDGSPVSVHKSVGDSHKRTIREMKRLAATDQLLVGTDGGGPALVLLGFAMRQELALMVEAGLSPAEVIRAATYNPAAFLGVEDVAGTVDVGKQADLLLVDGNPLKRIGRLQEIAGVMVRGVWLSSEELDDRLGALAERFE